MGNCYRGERVGCEGCDGFEECGRGGVCEEFVVGGVWVVPFRDDVGADVFGVSMRRER